MARTARDGLLAIRHVQPPVGGRTEVLNDPRKEFLGIGETWKIQRFEGLKEASWLSIYELAITEGPTIWAAGKSGNIIVSTDGGAFWFPVHGPLVQVDEELRRAMERPAN